MRIPTSTIVMTLALAVPVTLAALDSKSKKGSFKSSRDEMREEAEARMEREQVASAAADRDKQEKQEALFANVFGAGPAQLGPLFDGVRLGAPAASYEPDAVKRARMKVEADGGLRVRYEVDSVELVAVNVTVRGALGVDCKTKLESTWGEPTVHQMEPIWLDPAAHQRAVMQEHDSCAIRFDRYDDPHAWVERLPISAINAPVKQLKLDPSAYVTEHEIDWRGPGLGGGHAATNYTMTIEKGNVTDVLVHGDADLESLDDVRNLLTARLGSQPKETEGYRGTVYKWASRPPIALVVNERRFTLDIGGKEKLDR
jgi:hypothetical protein